MKWFCAALAAAGLLIASSGSARAAILVNYPMTRLNFPDGTIATDVQVDSANRIWFATTDGVTALSGTQIANGFPLHSVTSLKGFTNFSSVDFGPVNAPDQENFFLGANAVEKTGLLYGRMLSSGPNYATDFILTDNADWPTSSSAWGQVNTLASDRADRLWVGTGAGLVSVNLPGLTVANSLETGGPAVLHVAVANSAVSGTQAFFATSAQGVMQKLFAVLPGSPMTARAFVNLDFFGVGGLAVDNDGNLWVAESTRSDANAERKIYMYHAADLLSWLMGPPGPEQAPVQGFFNPDDDGSALKEARTINDMGINPLTGEVWLATSKGAFFQKMGSPMLLANKVCNLGESWPAPADDVDAASAVCDDSNRGWHPMPQNQSELNAVGESFRALLLDIAGNVWLGTDKGVRAIIARSLTLSGTRFIGEDARVRVFLNDDTKRGTEVSFTVAVGGQSATFAPTLDANGHAEWTFGFSFSATSDPAVSPYRFPVTPTSAGIPILVSYTFRDASGIYVTITASAAWAQIVPFEDDLWIGGPCYLKGLDRR